MNDRIAIEEREAAHWDSVALRPELQKEIAAFIEPNALDRANLALMRDLSGRRVLDVGCGSGEWTALIAAAGAFVDSIDISAGMVDVTKRRMKHLGLGDRVTASVMSAMKLDFPDETFDVVHGRYIIHHLDPSGFGREVARVLKPGGVAVFVENNGTNGLLMLARNYLCGRFGIPKWSSDDEYPMTPQRTRDFAQHFRSVELLYPEFIMFKFVDAKLFGYKVKPITRIVDFLDEIVGKIPALRRFSYIQSIVVSR